jgi:hypothetical protein
MTEIAAGFLKIALLRPLATRSNLLITCSREIQSFMATGSLSSDVLHFPDRMVVEHKRHTVLVSRDSVSFVQARLFGRASRRQ